MPYYTSITLINARLADSQITITSSSVPSANQVEAIIDQVEGEIHAYLRNNYPTPVTDTEAVKLLASLATSIVAERIFTLAYPNAESNPFTAESRQARELLKDLSRGAAALPSTNAPAPLPSHNFNNSNPFNPL